MPDTIAPDGPLQSKRDKYFRLLGIDKLSGDLLLKAQSGALNQLDNKQKAKAQKLATEIIQAEQKQKKALSEEEAKAEKEKILYTARREKFDLTLEYLRRRKPATDALLEKFDKADQQALRLLAEKPPNYAKALSALKDVSATHAPEKADELWDKASEKASRAAPQAFKHIRRIDELLSAPDLKLPDEDVQQVRVQRLQHKRALLAENLASQVVDQHTRALGVLADDLEQQIEDANELHDEVQQLHADTLEQLNDIAPLSGDLPPLLTDREAAPMRLALASAATSISGKDYESARQVLLTLQTEIDDISLRIGPLRDQWEQLKDRLDPAWKAASLLAAEAASEPVRREASALAASLDELRQGALGHGVGYPDAIARVGDAAATLKRLKKQDQQWQAFQGPPGQDPTAGRKGSKALEAARQRTEARFDSVDQALVVLHKQVRKATDGKFAIVADARFVARQQAARDEWDRRVGLAHDEATLDEEGMRATLQQLRDDILQLARDPVQLKAGIEDGRLQRARLRYQQARQKALAACERYIGCDAQAGGRMLLKIEALDGQLGSDASRSTYIQLAGQLDQTADEIDKACDEQETEVEDAQQELLEVLEPVPGLLVHIEELARKARTGEKQKPLLALLNTLQTSLDGLRAMAGLTQLPLLESAHQEAVAFVEEVKDSLQAARGEGSGDTLSFAQARKRIANLKVDLADKDLKLYRISSLHALNEELDALEQGLGSLTMKAMSQRLSELITRAARLQREAQQARQDTATFEKDIVAPLRARVAGKAFDAAPDYRKAIEGRIQALVGAHRFEGGQDRALDDARTLGQELDAILKGPQDPRGVPLTLAQAQQAELDRKNRKIVDKGRWEGDSEVMAKRLTALKDINPKEIGALQELLKSTIGTVKKSGDYGAAREQLQAIRNRLALIEANPNGLASTARNKLPQVNQRVKRAIAAYGQALDAVESAVKQLPLSDLDAEGQKAVAGQLASLRGIFNPASFDEVVGRMAAPSNSREVRSGAREQGLREIRRLQAYLKEDGRLRTLAATPFAKQMPSVLSELMLALLDLENNMLVSI